MTPPSPPRSRTGRIAVLGLLAFVLLAVRFSPDWFAFIDLARAAKAAASPEERQVIEQRLLSRYAERGYHVVRQAENLQTEIDNPLHKIVRWRLLVPAIGRVLGLPGWAVLALAHLGCVALVLLLAHLGARPRAGAEAGQAKPGRDAFCFALIAGAGAPFFASMGWLGYYDSWLAIALLLVGYARSRWVMLAACVLAPWIDERFVLGLPLALGVRRLAQTAEPPEGMSRWLRREAAPALALAGAYALVRLGLGGAGGSQSVGAYWQQFILGQQISVLERLRGAWEGLRLTWVVSAAAAAAALWSAPKEQRRLGLALAAVGAATALVGLCTALDMSRSMVLLIAVAPLAWSAVAAQAWWTRLHAGPVLAGLALAAPASHVVAGFAIPVEAYWRPPEQVVAAHINLGNLFAATPGRQEQAVAHYTEALRLKPGDPETHHNLGLMLAGKPGRQQEAFAHYSEALRLKPGYAEAHFNLANLLAVAPGHQESALAHYAHALRLDPRHVNAHINRAVLLANAGRADDALLHFHEALKLRPGSAELHNNLALLLASLPGREEESLPHFSEAARLLPGNPYVHLNYAHQLEKREGRKADAARHYARALELNPNLAEARAALERLRERP